MLYISYLSLYSQHCLNFSTPLLLMLIVLDVFNGLVIVFNGSECIS